MHSILYYIYKETLIMKKIISTTNAPAAVGPYSQGVQIGNVIYFSGQVPLDPATGKLVDGDVAAQTRQVIKNIDALLKSQNLTADHVVKATVFITNMDDFATINTEYAKFFANNPPARSCVQVSRLPLGAEVEIEVIAHI